MGDFNEKLGSDPHLIASVCAKNQLFDIQAHFHGDSAQITTYARGTTRLEYCLASSKLEQYIDASGFNLFNEYPHSDHRASFLYIRLQAFFGHNTPKLAGPDMRFVSTSSSDVTKFVNTMYSHLAENKVFHKYTDFCLDVDVVE
jgi:hypothetical protein